MLTSKLTLKYYGLFSCAKTLRHLISPGESEKLTRALRSKTLVSRMHLVMSDSLQSLGLYSPRNSQGQNTGVANHSLLQGTFPVIEPRSPLYRWILNQLSHQGSLRILELVAYPFSS